MQQPPTLTDRAALARNRARARAMGEGAMFLQREAIREVQERLELVNRSFTKPAVVAAFPHLWRDVLPGAVVVEDSEILPLEPGAHDLVVHAMALHWANDPVGQLVQAARALRPDGLLLAIFPGGRTLAELRAVLAEAEVAVRGGLSPRVLPMGEIRELGALLQRAGLALPVADSLTLTASYDSALHLMRELRAMGEANALASRERRPMRRAVLEEAVRRYAEAYGRDGRVPATFELITLTGWAPDASQPRPLRPGSAAARLADALGTEELPAGDPVGPVRG
jgi:SAM-dependent methyltransferase